MSEKAASCQPSSAEEDERSCCYYCTEKVDCSFFAQGSCAWEECTGKVVRRDKEHHYSTQLHGGLLRKCIFQDYRIRTLRGENSFKALTIDRLQHGLTNFENVASFKSTKNAYFPHLGSKDIFRWDGEKLVASGIQPGRKCILVVMRYESFLGVVSLNEQQEYTVNGADAQQITDSYSYEGEMKDNMKHGTGRIKYCDGSNISYEGQWDKDQMHGKGVYTFSNGDVYTGMMDHNGMSGRGEMKYFSQASSEYYPPSCNPPCPIFKGIFQDGKMSYGCVKTFNGQCGSIQFFHFQNGQLINYVKCGKPFYMKNKKCNYMGELKFLGLSEKYPFAREGTGTFVDCNGDIYEGEWLNNKRHGAGTLTTKQNGVADVVTAGTWFENILQPAVEQQEGRVTTPTSTPVVDYSLPTKKRKLGKSGVREEDTEEK